MSARTRLVNRLVEIVGPDLEIDALGTGWPSLATLHVGSERLPVALFVSAITLGHRPTRYGVERRFQNPASGVPLVDVAGRLSVLLGVWEEDRYLALGHPIVAVADARRRERRATRWSVFLALRGLTRALELGWASTTSESNERIYYLHPALLPVAIGASASGAEPDEAAVAHALGVLEFEDLANLQTASPAGERVRRTVTSLVRQSRFSGAVLGAYGGQCAMCGLGVGLVEGAHIYPVSAPGSDDRPSNGLALCANHHLAFDRHLVGVDPLTLQIAFHPSMLAAAASDPAVRRFVESTSGSLRPAARGSAPDREAFRMRYSYYVHEYDWLI